MAEEAQAYAQYLFDNGLFEHANDDQNPTDGENLAKKWSSYVDHAYTNTAGASDAWYDEVNDPGYNFNDPGYYENPGAGHFTAMVWKNTCEIGCGVAEGWDSAN